MGVGPAEGSGSTFFAFCVSLTTARAPTDRNLIALDRLTYSDAWLAGTASYTEARQRMTKPIAPPIWAGGASKLPVPPSGRGDRPASLCPPDAEEAKDP